MIQRVWFGAICALVIAGAVYWFGIRDVERVSPLANIYGTSTPSELGEDAGTVQGPQRPEGAGQGDINQSNQQIMKATLHTNKGDITFQFNPNTPNTVANFVKLAKAGFYDNTKFHRVIKGFMNQGGDPLSKDDSKKAQWGTGGPGYQFEDEIAEGNKNAPGTVAMANAGPNTNGSQFFINVADNSFLDTKHTVFGMVTEGAEAVMAINGAETDESDRPLDPVIIKSITLE